MRLHCRKTLKGTFYSTSLATLDAWARASKPFRAILQACERLQHRGQQTERVRGYNDPWAHGADRHRLA